MPRTVILSFVGEQPSAPAVSIKTLFAKRQFLKAPESPIAVRLFSNSKVQGQASRLLDYVSQLLAGTDITSEILAEGEGLRNFDAWRDDELVFLVDAGRRGAMVTTLMALRSLGREFTIGFNTSQELTLVSFATGMPPTRRSIPLENLGLDGLLGLYELSLTFNKVGAASLCHQETRRELTELLEPPFERHGRLFLRKDWPNGADADRRRMLAAVRYGWLAGIKPIVAVSEPNPPDHVDWELVRAQNTPEWRAQWLAGNVVPRNKGPSFPSHSSGEKKRTGAQPSWTGEPVCLGLGTNPLTTMIALESHRPSRALVLYDKEDSLARFHRQGIERAYGAQCGLRFVHVGFTGEQYPQLQDFRHFNLSAGTKIMAAMVTCLSPSGALFFVVEKARVRCLSAGTPSLNKQYPDRAVIANACQFEWARLPDAWHDFWNALKVIPFPAESGDYNALVTVADTTRGVSFCLCGSNAVLEIESTHREALPKDLFEVFTALAFLAAGQTSLLSCKRLGLQGGAPTLDVDVLVQLGSGSYLAVECKYGDIHYGRRMRKLGSVAMALAGFKKVALACSRWTDAGRQTTAERLNGSKDRAGWHLDPELLRDTDSLKRFLAEVEQEPQE